MVGNPGQLFPTIKNGWESVLVNNVKIIPWSLKNMVLQKNIKISWDGHNK